MNTRTPRVPAYLHIRTRYSPLTASAAAVMLHAWTLRQPGARHS
jgi:hypothetical protein